MVAGTLALALPSSARAASPGEYRDAIASALATVEAAEAADDAARSAALAQVAAILGAAERVTLAGGPTVATTDPPLRTALAAGDLDAVRAHLLALGAALDAAAAAPPPPADAQAQLAAVLAREEFQPPEPGPLTRLLKPLVEALQPALRPLITPWETVRLTWERFWRWVGSLFEGSSGGSGQGWVFLILGGLVVLAVAALVLGAFAGNVVGGAQVAAARPRARPSASASEARARALARAGDYRAALHELYLATLLALDERQLLRFRPELTNREHLVAGQPGPALATTLPPLVEAYDRLWYSGAPIAADDWTRFVALADATRAAPAGDGGGARPAIDGAPVAAP